VNVRHVHLGGAGAETRTGTLPTRTEVSDATEPLLGFGGVGDDHAALPKQGDEITILDERLVVTRQDTSTLK
jgi:hypothetical protein